MVCLWPMSRTMPSSEKAQLLTSEMKSSWNRERGTGSVWGYTIWTWRAERGALTADCFPFQLAVEVKIKQTKSLFSQPGHQTIWKWIIQVLFQNIKILEMKKALGQRSPERLLLCPRLLRPSVNGLILEYRSPDCHPMLFSLWTQMHSA